MAWANSAGVTKNLGSGAAGAMIPDDLKKIRARARHILADFKAKRDIIDKYTIILANFDVILIIITKYPKSYINLFMNGKMPYTSCP